MNSTNLTAESFLCEALNYREEAFDMVTLNENAPLVGGFSPFPNLPNTVTLDLMSPLSKVSMYVNHLKVYCLPHELAVKKALEFIYPVENYELNIASFRMELVNEALHDKEHVREIDAVVAALRVLCKYLMDRFSQSIASNLKCFPYEYHLLHLERYLVLTKIVVDAKLNPLFNPNTVARPGYTYREMCEAPRAYAPAATY